MERYSKDISKNSTVKFILTLFLLSYLALVIRIIFLIAYHSTGEYYGIAEYEPCCVLFQDAAPGTERRLQEAHYLMFVAMILEAAFLLLLNITARWMVIYPQLVNDMSSLYRAPKMHHSTGASTGWPICFGKEIC